MLTNTKPSDNSTRPLKGTISPLNFFGVALVPTYLAIPLIPTVFVLMKQLGISVPGGDFFEYAAIASSKFVWPLFQGHYQSIKSLVSAEEAARYALFFLVILMSNCFFAAILIVSFRKCRSLIKLPNMKEVFALVVCVPGAIYSLIFDVAKKAPKPVYDFYLDIWGLYYFRQAALIYSFYVILFAALIVIAATINALLPDRAERE